MKNEINLSIIIPVYNGVKYIKECLDSIIDEIDDTVETIIIDDGSTDGSEEVYSKYHQIKFYKNQNHGVSYSRNFGITKATGKYIMFVDCDDRLIKGWYHTIKKIISENDSDDIIYFSQKFEKKFPTKETIVESIIGYNYHGMKVNMASACSKLYKRKFIKNSKIIFSENIINGEDLLFNINAIFHTNKYSVVSYSFYQYRLNYVSATHIYNPIFFQSNTTFLKKLEETLEENHFAEKKIKQYINYCLLHSIEIFIYKISLIKEPKIRSDAIKIFREKIYKEYIENPKNHNNQNVFLNIILRMLKRKNYKLAIYLMKIKNLVNMIRKSKKKRWEIL